MKKNVFLKNIYIQFKTYIYPKIILSRLTTGASNANEMAKAVINDRTRFPK